MAKTDTAPTGTELPAKGQTKNGAQTKESNVTEATATAPAKQKKPTLPKIVAGRLHDSKEKLDAAQAEGKKHGYPAKKIRKFKLSDGNGKTVFALSSSSRMACATAAARLGIKVEELDPVHTAKVPDVDSILGSMSMLSEADLKRVKEALARGKK